MYVNNASLVDLWRIVGLIIFSSFLETVYHNKINQFPDTKSLGRSVRILCHFSLLYHRNAKLWFFLQVPRSFFQYDEIILALFTFYSCLFSHQKNLARRYCKLNNIEELYRCFEMRTQFTKKSHCDICYFYLHQNKIKIKH